MTSFPSEPSRPASGPGDSGSETGGPPPAPSRADEEGEPEGIRFRDNRRIDPVTFEARPAPVQPGSDSVEEAVDHPGEPAPMVDAESVAADERVVELTADLQRLSAEYTNYRRRVERDRALSAELTTASLMTKLLPILDDIQRAEEHGELNGGFAAVADSIRSLADSTDLTRFGDEGDLFDPNFHEAMTSNVGPDVEEPTVTHIYQVGYRINDRVLRPARVGVTDAE